jgi:hypothetical protein
LSLTYDLDGSIPRDDPNLNGVVSHVYTYGHRNMQGIDFGPDGTLYAPEQGPTTDDEINILKPGANYGWPHVAGLMDNKAYKYARWAESTIPCTQLTFSDLAIPPSVPREPESAFTKPFVEPIATMFTVPSDYNFHSAVCKDVDFISWPTVGASSVEYYASKGKGVPGWDKVLLITTLKRGSLYVLPLTPDGQHAAGTCGATSAPKIVIAIRRSIRTGKPFISPPMSRGLAKRSVAVLTAEWRILARSWHCVRERGQGRERRDCDAGEDEPIRANRRTARPRAARRPVSLPIRPRPERSPTTRTARRVTATR